LSYRGLTAVSRAKLMIQILLDPAIKSRDDNFDVLRDDG